MSAANKFGMILHDIVQIGSSHLQKCEDFQTQQTPQKRHHKIDIWYLEGNLFYEHIKMFKINMILMMISAICRFCSNCSEKKIEEMIPPRFRF